MRKCNLYLKRKRRNGGMGGGCRNMPTM
jgi:hypothetical protein